jgi:type IV secretory pathway VirB6-like protein
MVFAFTLIDSSKALPFSDFFLLPSMLKGAAPAMAASKEKGMQKRFQQKGSASFCLISFIYPFFALHSHLFPLYMVASGSFVFPSIVCALLYSDLLYVFYPKLGISVQMVLVVVDVKVCIVFTNFIIRLFFRAFH